MAVEEKIHMPALVFWFKKGQHTLYNPFHRLINIAYLIDRCLAFCIRTERTIDPLLLIIFQSKLQWRPRWY